MTTLGIRSSHASPSILDRIKKNQTVERRSISEVLARIFSTHIPTAYERDLNAQLDWIFDTMVVELDKDDYAPTSQLRGGRALVLPGAAGVGKSWTIRYVFANRPELAWDSSKGEDPAFLSVVAPSPFTLGALGNEVVRRLGYGGSREIQHSKVWPLVRELMAEKGIRILHIDEAQHGDEIVGAAEAQVVENTFKRLMQDETWTVWLVLSGLPSLARFCQADESMRRRVRIVPFEPLQYPHDVVVVGETLARIGKAVPLMDCKSIASDSFSHRLLHASLGSYGVLIEYVQDAIAECLMASETMLAPAHFADVYALRTGVMDDRSNPFLARNWTNIAVETALFEEKLDGNGKAIGSQLKTRQTKGLR